MVRFVPPGGTAHHEGGTMATDGIGERKKALEQAVLQIEKQYGKGSIMRLGETPQERVPAISTASIALDYALGVGGVPRGRVIEIFGPEASGPKISITR